MQLALFTPGAHLWPVYRNFESFIAGISTIGTDALDIGRSGLYPLGSSLEPQRHMTPAVDRRLTQLHQELYQGLLRPAGYFKQESTGFADFFWPDLRHTPVDALFEALLFYFSGLTLDGLSVTRGLSVLRTVFFNHESAEPALWLDSARQRLLPLQDLRPAVRGTIALAATVRLPEMAFCIHSGQTRPVSSAGWLTGQFSRTVDGRLMAHFEAGLNPALLAAPLEDQQATVLPEVLETLGAIFGWREAVA